MNTLLIIIAWVIVAVFFYKKIQAEKIIRERLQIERELLIEFTDKEMANMFVFLNKTQPEYCVLFAKRYLDKASLQNAIIRRGHIEELIYRIQNNLLHTTNIPNIYIPVTFKA